jgi:hypothetical protein
MSTKRPVEICDMPSLCHWITKKIVNIETFDELNEEIDFIAKVVHYYGKHMLVVVRNRKLLHKVMFVDEMSHKITMKELG